MKPYTRFVSLALLAAVAFAPAAQAATPTAIAACNKTLRKEVVGTIKKGADLVAKCQSSIEKGKLPPATNCNADFIAEMGDAAPASPAYGGKAAKLKDTLQKKLAKSCSGEDVIVGTADDVNFDADVLTSPNLKKGSLGWALDLNETTEIVPYATLPDANVSLFEAEVTDDCLVLQDQSDWLAKSQLQRGIEELTCLVIGEAKAESIKAGLAFATDSSVSKVRMSLVKPNITYDSGNDTSPVDGVPESANIPSMSGCPLPGVGACAGNPTINCSLAPGSGTNLFCVEDSNTVCTGGGAPYPCCTGPGTASCGCAVAGAPTVCPPYIPAGGLPVCAEALKGPDGITAGEAPAGSLGYGKVMMTIQNQPAATPANAYAESAVIKCWVEGVKDGASALVTTTQAGTCNCGTPPGAGCVVGACGSSADCDTVHSPSQYACLSGDEYHCQVDGLTSSNRDNSPACGGPGTCLLVLVPGPAGGGCGLPGGGLCAVGTCVGGVRNGQGCDITGVTACPGGGTCSAGGPAVLTGDEVGFYAPAFGGMAYLTCPAKFRLDFAMDLIGGAGVAVQDVAQVPMNLCLPTGTGIQTEGAYIHEPGAGSTALLQFYTGGAGLTKSADKIPCPDVAQALPASSSGLPTSTGVGPIIGVTGAAVP